MYIYIYINEIANIYSNTNHEDERERENDRAYNTNERLAFVMMMNRRRL